MKLALTISFLFILSVMAFAGPKYPPVIATARMDGLGYYRLTNYVERDGCLVFYDFTGEQVTFCGAYEVKPVGPPTLYVAYH